MSYMETAKKAAKEAGKVLIKYYNQDGKIRNNKKKDNSFVSEADLAAERLILGIITKKYPRHAFYSEEKGKSKNESDYCWYIDPLDGTHNFIHRLPFFGVSIALAKKDEFILGVTYFPYLNELFYAEKGKGAFLNGKKIKVSNNKFKDSMALMAATNIASESKVLEIIRYFLPLCSDIRMLNCCSVELSYLAAGRNDFTIHPSTTPYDAGAGKVILEEAGGIITQINGKPFTPKSNDFIASNGVFHKNLVKIVGSEFK